LIESNAKLGAIMTALRVNDVAARTPTDDELRTPRAEQGDIQTIRRCHELTGYSLAEAREYVGAL
jgi:ribosomal protein L7/L12